MGVMDGKSFLKVGKEIGWVGNVLWIGKDAGIFCWEGGWKVIERILIFQF